MSNAVVTPTALTSSQCRAGRALLEWSQQQLSQAAAIDLQTIANFEKRLRAADETTRRRLRAALEAAGVVFIAENGGGAGARLKFSREEVWEVNRGEDEGVAGEGDIP
jgi:transcriptional regulator with XRE-family HTH domain